MRFRKFKLNRQAFLSGVLTGSLLSVGAFALSFVIIVQLYPPPPAFTAALRPLFWFAAVYSCFLLLGLTTSPLFPAGDGKNLSSLLGQFAVTASVSVFSGLIVFLPPIDGH